MSCLKDEVLHEPTIKLVDEYCLISTSDVIKVSNFFIQFNAFPLLFYYSNFEAVHSFAIVGSS